MAAAAVLTFGFLSCTVNRTVAEPPRTVTVSGTGAVYSIPDTATISLAVESESWDVKTATEDNAAKMTAVQKAVADSGIAKNDISTSDYNIYRQSSWQNGRNIPGKYRVTNSIQIVVHDISHCGTVIDTAVSAGANSFSSVSFDISNKEEAERQARTLAIQKAHENAKLLATASGAQLGPVLTIAEDAAADFHTANITLKAAARESTGVTPVAAGRKEISVTVTATYSLQ